MFETIYFNMITESLEVIETAKQFDEIMQMIFRTPSTYTKLLNGLQQWICNFNVTLNCSRECRKESCTSYWIFQKPYF